VLHTPVTCAPKYRASWTAAVPTPPEAPTTSTFSPRWSFAFRKKLSTVVPPNDKAAASSCPRLAGLSATASSFRPCPSSGRHRYSAWQPMSLPVKPKTSSPTW